LDSTNSSLPLLKATFIKLSIQQHPLKQKVALIVEQKTSPTPITAGYAANPYNNVNPSINHSSIFPPHKKSYI
jgi:hypothetical protein